MPVLDVDGVRVNFPFEPYACQVTYMEKVIKCLKEVKYRNMKLEWVSTSVCVWCGFEPRSGHM